MRTTTKSKPVVGLDIEAGSVAAAEVASNGHTAVGKFGVIPLSAGLFRDDVAVHLHGHLVAALVEDQPGDVVGLARDLERLLRISLVLVREALAVLVDLVAALGDRRPADVGVVRRGDRAVALEGAHVLDRGAERLAPLHCVPSVAYVPVVMGVDHFRDVFGDERLVAAVPAAGEDQRVAADVLGLAVGPRYAHAAHAAVRVDVQVSCARGGGERNVLLLDRREQRRQ